MTLSEVISIVGLILAFLQLVGVCIFLGRVYEQLKQLILNFGTLKDETEKRFLRNEDIVFKHITNTGIHQGGEE